MGDNGRRKKKENTKSMQLEALSKETKREKAKKLERNFEQFCLFILEIIRKNNFNKNYLKSSYF